MECVVGYVDNGWENIHNTWAWKWNEKNKKSDILLFLYI